MRQHAKDCKGQIGIRRLSTFDASTILGTPFAVVLHDAVDEKYCLECNSILGHIIPHPKDLSSVVAVLRAANPKKLCGKEIRFLRKSLARKAKDLADDIALSPEQLSRFENDKQPISEVYERLLRAIVCLGHFDTTSRLGIDAKHLLSMRIPSVRDCNDSVSTHLEFEIASIESPIPSDEGDGKPIYKVAS